MKKTVKKLLQSTVFTKIVLPIILVVILAIIGYATFKSPTATGGKELSPEEAKVKTEEFINTYLMAQGSKATIEEITEELGLYKIKVNIGGENTVDSYIDKGLNLFFPQAFVVADMQNGETGDAAGNGAAPTPITQAPKNDKPVVEVFVMSHCPYGTQIEKGILPVAKALGSKIDFQLKFVDYAMHGEVELKEQLVQYCIDKEQEAKLFPYLDCFLIDGKSDSCLTTAGVDKGKLDACVKAADAQFKVTENFNNKVDYSGTFPGFAVHKADNTKYGVQGSPTLVINGEQIQSGRDAASLMTAICGAFNSAPAECNTQMSSDTPAPGFGTGTTANAAAASCN